MASNNDGLSQSLKARAENILSETGHRADRMTLEEVKAVIHDLRVHQVELELQNEELRRAQEELQQVTSKYARLFDNAPAGYLIVDQSGRIIQANGTFGGLVGTDAGSLTGQSFFDLVTEDDRPGLISRFKAFYNRPLKKTIELKMRAGRAGFFHARIEGRFDDSSVLFDDWESKDRLLLVITDVTRKREIELALTENEKRYRLLLDNSLQGMVVVQADPTRVVFASRPMSEITGYPTEDLTGMTEPQLVDLIHPDDRARFFSNFRDRMAGRSVPPGNEYRILHRRNGVRWVQALSTRIEYGSQPASQTVFLDITEKKKAEQEQLRLEQELRHAQKMEALGTLAGGIAHDFNNILAIIQGFSELTLEEVDADSVVSTNLEQILSAGKRARDLVTQILTFSRKLKPRLKVVDLNREVEEIGELLGRTLPKMVEIEFGLKADLWPVQADSSQLSQVLMNLATNASDAMSGAGKLTIETDNAALDEEYCLRNLIGRPGDFILLTVSDTGCGMDKLTQTKIFDPFFTSKGIGQGTGLGLSTVYGIVKQHQGHINCYSEPGRGTTFKIYLPAAKEIREADGPVPRRTGSTPGGTERILLVDDEEALRVLGHRILTRQGYRVTLAETGEEALALYREQGRGIDAVVLDISMPGMGGHKCLEELMKIDPEAKVIIASGYSLNGQLKDTMTMGASDFVPKPFSKTELLKTLREVMDR